MVFALYASAAKCLGSMRSFAPLHKGLHLFVVYYEFMSLCAELNDQT